MLQRGSDADSLRLCLSQLWPLHLNKAWCAPHEAAGLWLGSIGSTSGSQKLAFSVTETCLHLLLDMLVGTMDHE